MRVFIYSFSIYPNQSVKLYNLERLVWPKAILEKDLYKYL